MWIPKIVSKCNLSNSSHFDSQINTDTSGIGQKHTNSLDTLIAFLACICLSHDSTPLHDINLVIAQIVVKVAKSYIDQIKFK